MGKPIDQRACARGKFFEDDVLLHSPTAVRLYEGVKTLPIVDYHSHLPVQEIAENKRYTTITELWLKSDHYKWRAMRACGIPEHRITGDANDEEKFLAYAAIMPKLIGNPLYYWAHFELKTIFGIEGPLNSETAPAIYRVANDMLRLMLPVRELLHKLKVEYIATTDDPVSDLSLHGMYEGIRVCPTFRPDRALRFERSYLEELASVSGRTIRSLDDWSDALEARLTLFLGHGCTVADVSMEEIPAADVTKEEAEALFSRTSRTPLEAHRLYSYGMRALGALLKKHNIVWQLHIGALRNINAGAFRALGADTGYDVMRGAIDTDGVAAFLDSLSSHDALPKLVLYCLNPGALPALSTIAPCFPDVRIGAAWWFNDTLKGIRSHLETLAEYSLLGTSLGMLTDSRSFSSYCRFDFFRRILCDFVAEKVDGGEYDGGAAEALLRDICYRNPKTFLNLGGIQ